MITRFFHHFKSKSETRWKKRDQNGKRTVAFAKKQLSGIGMKQIFTKRVFSLPPSEINMIRVSAE